MKPNPTKLEKPTTIGEQIAYWRQARKLTQGELAEFFDRKAAWLSMIEKGNRRIDAQDLYEISQILRVPIQHFYPSR